MKHDGARLIVCVRPILSQATKSQGNGRACGRRRIVSLAVRRPQLHAAGRVIDCATGHEDRGAAHRDASFTALHMMTGQQATRGAALTCAGDELANTPRNVAGPRLPACSPHLGIRGFRGEVASRRALRLMHDVALNSRLGQPFYLPHEARKHGTRPGVEDHLASDYPFYTYDIAQYPSLRSLETSPSRLGWLQARAQPQARSLFRELRHWIEHSELVVLNSSKHALDRIWKIGRAHV